VGQQVHHRVRPGERGGQGGLVEHVGVDGAGAEALEHPTATRRPRDAGDVVARSPQLIDGTPPDDTGGSSDHDLAHDHVTFQPGES
jgi:hypothetical protein